MSRLRIAAGLVALMAIVGVPVVSGQASAPRDVPPVLSETARLELIVAIQALELSEVRRTALDLLIAQQRRAVIDLAARHDVDGYTLDLERLVYVPTTTPPAPNAPAREETDVP